MNFVQRKVELITRIWRLLSVLFAACLVCDKNKVSQSLWSIICEIYDSVITQKTVGVKNEVPKLQKSGMTFVEKSWCHSEDLFCVALAIRVRLFPPIRPFLFFQVI